MSTSDTAIADQVVAMQQKQAGHLPADVVAIFGEEVTRLDAAGVPDAVAGAGTVMPDGELLDVSGQPTTLAAVRHGRAAVVVFYRGAWCPYCNLTLRTYQETLVPELTGRDVALIAVSPQRPDGSLSMQETNHLTYEVVSDPGNQIAGELGIVMTHGEDARAAQAKLGLDLTEVNADGTHNLPMPTVAIVDSAGVIRWIDVHPNFTTRTEPSAILDALTSTIGKD